jgi:hypothetical protein
MKKPNDMKSLNVICIKTFTINNITYRENLKYHIIQYVSNVIKYNNFYIYDEKIKVTTNPTYSLNIKYRKYFMTEKELRTLKIQKLNESSKI